MFKYVYPQFEKKRLLRGEMLDQLRDYPKNYIKMSFQGYGDGSWQVASSPGTMHGLRSYPESFYIKAAFISWKLHTKWTAQHWTECGI